MKYIELKIYTSEYGIEPVTAMLLEQGITGAVVNNPHDVELLMEKKNGYEWDYLDPSVITQKEEEPTVVVYFDDTEDDRQRMQDVKLALMMLKSKEMEGVFGWDASLGRLYAEDKIVDDAQWKDKWKEYFRPTKVTEHLVIKPTWEPYTAKEGELVIELDPGMAFGTGAHETTVLCLELMEKYLKPGQKVLDVGCGSGILSIAADLMGSGDVLAVDIDPDAVEVAKENIKSDRVKVVQGDLITGIDFRADIIVANLSIDLLELLSPSVGKHLEADGIYISSGILREKREQAKAIVEEAGFRIVEIIEKGEWCAIGAAL